jgi:hypothetical protein
VSRRITVLNFVTGYGDLKGDMNDECKCRCQRVARVPGICRLSKGEC